MNLKKIGAILTIGGMVISGSYATLSPFLGDITI